MVQLASNEDGKVWIKHFRRNIFFNKKWAPTGLTYEIAANRRNTSASQYLYGGVIGIYLFVKFKRFERSNLPLAVSIEESNTLAPSRVDVPRTFFSLIRSKWLQVQIIPVQPSDIGEMIIK
jgi:hypothetical protein